MNFFIKSYGCQMNLYDSQRIEDLLLSKQHSKMEDIEKANLIIFNTCSIREKADDKLFSDLGRANLLKQTSKEINFIIIVAGCVAQSRFQDILKRCPYVDAVVGPQDIQNIPDRIDDLIQHRDMDTLVLTKLDPKDKFEKFNNIFSFRSISEFLTIQEGCDNFCTYCVVPYTRGREFSRSVQEIVSEAKNLISRGCKEITLLGQNVNSYNGLGDDGKNWRLSQLLWELSKLSGLKRLRYTTSNPKDVDEDIAKAHRDIPILMPFLHLPVQSGSNSVLKKMNRKYTREKYLDVVNMLRDYRPDMAFSSDFIVGFPGESDSDFEDTINLVKRVKYSQSYSFKYSPRQHTPAAKMDNQISEKIKAERLKVLQNLLNSQQSEFNKNSIGKIEQVLFVKKGRNSNQINGRNEYFQAVTVNTDKAEIGDISNIKITNVSTHGLIGELV